MVNDPRQRFLFAGHFPGRPAAGHRRVPIFWFSSSGPYCCPKRRGIIGPDGKDIDYCRDFFTQNIPLRRLAAARRAVVDLAHILSRRGICLADGLSYRHLFRRYSVQFETGGSFRWLLDGTLLDRLVMNEMPLALFISAEIIGRHINGEPAAQLKRRSPGRHTRQNNS